MEAGEIFYAKKFMKILCSFLLFFLPVFQYTEKQKNNQRRVLL